MKKRIHKIKNILKKDKSNEKKGIETKEFWNKQKQNKTPVFWWEIALLVVLILVVASTYFISPVFFAPKGQFLFSFDSANYVLDAAVAGIGADFSSASYTLNIIAGESNGVYDGVQYRLELGSGQIIYSGDVANGTLIIDTTPIKGMITVTDSQNRVVLYDKVPTIVNLTPGNYRISFTNFSMYGFDLIPDESVLVPGSAITRVNRTYNYAGIAVYDPLITPVDGSNFSEMRTYLFGISIRSNNFVQYVNFTLYNSSNIPVVSFMSDGSPALLASNERYSTPSFTGLSAGSYKYYWFVRDSLNNQRIFNQTYIINPGNSDTHLYINGKEEGRSVSWGDNVSLRATSATNTLNTTIYVDAIVLRSGFGEVVYSLDTLTLNAKTTPYIITAETAGDKNWIRTVKQYNLIVANISYGDINVSPLSGVIYNPNQIYDFYSFWRVQGMRDMSFELNDGSQIKTYRLSDGNVSQNYDVVSGRYRYNVSIRGMAAGRYYYRWYGIDMANKTVSSNSMVYDINASPVSLVLKIGNQAGLLEEKSKVFTRGDVLGAYARINVNEKPLCLNITTPLGINYANCSITESFVSYPLGEDGRYTITALFAGDVNYSSGNITRWAAVVLPGIGDNADPIISNVNQSTERINENYYDFGLFVPRYKISAWIYASDNTLLRTAYLMTNESGVWQKKDERFINAPNAVINFTFATNATAGNSIGWRINITDDFGRYTVSEAKSFNIYDVADANYDRRVNMIEVLNAITQYYKRQMGFAEIMRSLTHWVSGEIY